MSFIGVKSLYQLCKDIKNRQNGKTKEKHRIYTTLIQKKAPKMECRRHDFFSEF